jgi:hypothetical protein
VKLESLVDGMKIGSKKDFVCEPCILGKQTQTINREPSRRATKPLEFVSTDLAGPITPASVEGFEYAISFIDNYSGYTFVYFLQNKSDAAHALSKFLADVSPIGKVGNLLNLLPEAVVKKLRSDNGGEFMGEEFKTILLQHNIRHEQCSPYSPHQNGVVERGWRTLFESARSSLVEANLPRSMWPYALMNAAHIRNRCYQNRTKQTPYFLLTGRKPDVSTLHVFGTICYAYEQDKKKLDDRSRRGVFVGYDRYSPSYLVYHPDSKRIQRCRCVKFTEKFVRNVTFSEVNNVETENTVTPEVHDASTENPITNSIRETDPISSNPTPISSETDLSDATTTNVDETVASETRTRNQPSYLKDYVCLMMPNKIPNTFKQAMQSEDSDMWKKAMDEEIDSLDANDTYELVPLPPGKKTVGGRWVYSIKDGPDGSQIFKARFVAKGFTQVKDVDYFDTFSPTVKMTSIRAFMQIAAEYGLSLSQMDVKTAFLNAPIDCEIYVEQPRGYESPGGLVCKLKKSLYGLKQSGRNWNNTLHEFFTQNALIQSDVDPCIYFQRCDDEFLAIVAVWVDDLIIGARDRNLLNELKAVLKNRFRMKDLGPLTYFLGIEFVQEAESINMSQSHYTKKLLLKFGMADSRPRSTPCEAKPDVVTGTHEPLKNVKYREVVGSLIYLMTCTRPDISWTVTRLSQKLENPGTAEWIMVKHVLQYLKGTVNNGLLYQKSARGLSLVGYSDSDWASCIESRRSTTGYYFALNSSGPPVSWKSRKQQTVALSTCEAEYMALTECVQEASFLQMLLSDLIPISLPIPIYGDNNGALCLVKNPIVSNRTKHIDIKHHYIREKCLSNFISVSHVSTSDNVADVFTKPMLKNKLNHFKKMLFGKD